MELFSSVASYDEAYNRVVAWLEDSGADLAHLAGVPRMIGRGEHLHLGELTDIDLLHFDALATSMREAARGGEYLQIRDLCEDIRIEKDRRAGRTDATCGICHRELDEDAVADPEWGAIHKRCQDSIGSRGSSRVGAELSPYGESYDIPGDGGAEGEDFCVECDDWVEVSLDGDVITCVNGHRWSYEEAMAELDRARDDRRERQLARVANQPEWRCSHCGFWFPRDSWIQHQSEFPDAAECDYDPGEHEAKIAAAVRELYCDNPVHGRYEWDALIKNYSRDSDDFRCPECGSDDFVHLNFDAPFEDRRVAKEVQVCDECGKSTDHWTVAKGFDLLCDDCLLRRAADPKSSSFRESAYYWPDGRRIDTEEKVAILLERGIVDGGWVEKWRAHSHSVGDHPVEMKARPVLHEMMMRGEVDSDSRTPENYPFELPDNGRDYPKPRTLEYAKRASQSCANCGAPVREGLDGSLEHVFSGGTISKWCRPSEADSPKAQL